MSPHSPEALPQALLSKLQTLAHEKLGLECRPGKELLLNLRTGRHMRELGISDPSEYLRLLENDSSGESVQGLMDLLTTNHTAFWREPSHFEWLLSQFLTHWNGPGKQTIWCAAASSGEEPYTLAMVACEALGMSAGQRIRILATDVSTRMLRVARAGVYTRDRIRPLPAPWQEKYFDLNSNGNYRVKREIQAMVHFRRLNLMEPFPRMGPFPAIFCRNVMIYFSQETRLQIVQRLLQMLTPEGYLLVGHAEGLSGLEANTDYVQPAIYRKRPARGISSAQGEMKWRR